MFERLNRMVLAPMEDVPAGGAGGVPAAPPAAAPSPSPAAPAEPAAPRLPFVNPDAPPDPAAAGPRGSAPAPGAPGGAPPVENHIPYSRVKQMLDAERQRVAQELRREFDSRRVDPERQLQVVREALKLAGIEVPEEQAAPPPSRQEIQNYIQSQIGEIRQQQAIQTEYEQGVRELSTAQQQYADYFQADPSLEARCKALWGATGDKSMAQIVAEQVQALDAFYSQRTARYAAQKAGDRRVIPVRPGGAPGGARAPQHDLSTAEGQDSALDELLGAEG